MSLDVPLLEQSFAKVRPRSEQFAIDFYDDLFTRFPATRAFFAGSDMPTQRKKLMDSLVLVIENIDNGDLLAGAMRNLGARHARMGIQPEHFDLVGASLLSTFEKHLGADWTPATKQAWTDAYAAITGLMTAA